MHLWSVCMSYCVLHLEYNAHMFCTVRYTCCIPGTRALKHYNSSILVHSSPSTPDTSRKLFIRFCPTGLGLLRRLCSSLLLLSIFHKTYNSPNILYTIYLLQITPVSKTIALLTGDQAGGKYPLTKPFRHHLLTTYQLGRTVFKTSRVRLKS